MLRDRSDRERGAGVLSMTIGMMMFLIMLVFAVNLLYNLYTTSVISSLALDAARDAAELGGDTGAAMTEFESQVADATQFTITETDTHVVVTIAWTSRSLFPALDNDAPAFGTINRTFTVRREQQQEQ